MARSGTDKGVATPRKASMPAPRAGGVDPLSSEGDRPPIRAAIVGTGYIADFHARAIRAASGVELVAVCDTNLAAAQGFAATHGGVAYRAVADMLAGERIDAVHVLTPPDLHHPVAKAALESGAHVFVEKPMCVDVAECDDLLAIAAARGLHIGVNHSAAFAPAFQTLRDAVKGGALGAVDHITISHLSELGVIRFGPFGNWIVRQPGNALLEIGPHPISMLVDLVGVPDRLAVTVDREVSLPGGGVAYNRWRIQAECGRVAADITLQFSPGFPMRTIAARGALGAAQCDLNANTCTVDRRTPGSMDFDRRARSLDQARQLKAQARRTLADTLLAKAKLGGRGNPDQVSITDCVGAFYAELRDPARADPRVAGGFGRDVIGVCERIIASADLRPRTPAAPARPIVAQPGVMVLGGGGFIGKRLIERLLSEGHAVRVASRSPSPALLDLGSDRLELVRADMRSQADLELALDGVARVVHLATTDAKTWPQFLEREVEPTRALGEACLARGVERLVYAGTIDSFYAGAKAGTIDEDTALDPGIAGRNNYARAKAAAEAVLVDLHRTRGLPLVIARPGIVIGRGGNPFHWGVGRWPSEGVCEVWGDGRNPLPLVLVDDVAAGLAAALTAPGIEGRAYNLVDAPLLSARDYLTELQRMSGMTIDVRYRPTWRYWLEDFSKWPVKVAVRHPDASRRPTHRDWESRSQKATWDTRRTQDELGWRPAADRQRMIDEGIGGALAGWLAARG